MERGDEKATESTIAKGDGQGLVIQCIQDVYKRTSRQIHEGEYSVVPIQLGQLTDIQAAVMMELCRQYPVKYGLYDVNGLCIQAPETPVDLVRRRRQEEEGDEEDA